MKLTDLSRIRLEKAIKELQHSPGWQDIRRFYQAEVATDDPDTDGLTEYLIQRFREYLGDEAENARKRLANVRIS